MHQKGKTESDNAQMPFWATEISFLGNTITPERVKSQNKTNQLPWKKTEFPK